MYPQDSVSILKGTTSIRLFLFLSSGIISSRFIPLSPAFLPLIILPLLLLVSIILHLARQYRLSISVFYALLFAYGLFLSPFDSPLSLVHSPLSVAKDALISLQGKALSRANAPLLAAITFGDKASLSSSLVTDFRTAGVAHVLVVSGMHVGFIYLLVSFIARRLPSRRLSLLLGVLLLWGYAALVGFAPSVCRASFMFTVMLLMRTVGECYRSFHALFLAAFLQLLISPSALFDIGFQLSYTAVLSILLFYPLFPDVEPSSFQIRHIHLFHSNHFTHPSRFLHGIHLFLNTYHSRRSRFLRSIYSSIRSHFPKHLLPRILQSIYNAIRLTISAQILIAPLVAYYFGQFPLYFVLTNLALTLLVPIVFIGGFLLLVPYISTFIAYPLNLLLDLLRSIVSAVASLPMALVQVRITLTTLILIYLLIILVLAYALSTPHPK